MRCIILISEVLRYFSYILSTNTDNGLKVIRFWNLLVHWLKFRFIFGHWYTISTYVSQFSTHVCSTIICHKIPTLTPLLDCTLVFCLVWYIRIFVCFILFIHLFIHNSFVCNRKLSRLCRCRIYYWQFVNQQCQHFLCILHKIQVLRATAI